MTAKRKVPAPAPKPPVHLPVIAILVACILLLAFIVRMLPLFYDISGGHVLFSGLDSYYHMRRIMYTVLHFPATNVFDSYVNYPAGFPIYWPPLYDQISAGLSLIAGLGHPSGFMIELASALVPALIGVLSIIPLFLLVRDLLGRYAAVIAALIMAILPGSAYQTLFGATDHHGLEVLLSLTMYLLFTRAVANAHGKDTKSLMKDRKTVAYAILAGISIAAMVFAWDGAPLMIGLLVLYAFVQYAYDAYQGEPSTYLSYAGSIAVLSALVILTPFVATGTGSQQVTPLLISWFHVLYLIAILVFFLFMGLISSVRSRRAMPWYTLPASAIALSIVVSGIIYLLTPNFFRGVGEGLLFLVAGNSVQSTIQEMQPLFLYGGQFSFAVPWAYLSTAMLLSVLGLIAFLISLHGRKIRQAELFLLCWTALAIVLGLLQQRFIYVLAVNVSVFAGYLLYAAMDLAGLNQHIPAGLEEGGNKRKTRARQKSRSASTTPALTMVAIFSFILLSPLLLGSVALALTPEPYMADWNEACLWVQGHTPATSYTYSADTGTHPEYGILSWWDYGNYILYRAERPAIANNFQTGVDSAADFFTAQNETAADAIMDQVNARYVMLDERMGSPAAGVPDGIFESIAGLAGEDPATYHLRINSTTVTVSPKYDDTMYARLFDFDGSGARDKSGNATQGLEHYRLVYATNGSDPVKVFQYVKGADIAGKAAPGSTVLISANLSLPDGGRTYDSTTTATADGRYNILVPYPGDYAIKAGATASSANVSEDAVAQGDLVTTT